MGAAGQGQPLMTEHHPNGSAPEMTGILAELAVTLGSVRQALAGEKIRTPVIPWDACHPVDPQGALGASGTFDSPDLLGPHDPYWWDLRLFTAFGFTAGSVSIYKNSTSGRLLGVLPSPGNITWSAQTWLRPRDRIIVVAAGITGTVQFELEANEVQSSWVPEYVL